MGLQVYHKKRNFNSTIEPKGKIEKANKKELRFVIQHHEARAKHYDFRLEWKGVLLSWAVPKGLSNNPKTKRLAVMVEDHPLDYIGFEGVIPKGNYGAGTVEIFDRGTFYPLDNFEKGLKKGHIKFILKGQKFNGEWSLVRIDEKNWLIIKSKEESPFKQSKKEEKLPFKECSAQLATLSNDIPKGKNWFFEIKYDGYRIISFVQNKIKLVSRNGNDYTKKLSSIANALQKIERACVLDGEVVAFDKEGRSDFGLLQERMKFGGELFYVVFDILALGDKDLRDQPFKERRKQLENVLNGAPKNIILSSGVLGKGAQSFKLAKKLGLEGIVAKEINSVYSGKRNEDWLKIKCFKRQEFVIVGYTKSAKNKYLSAILLGYYKNNSLVYAGKCGTGFTETLRKELDKKLSKLKIKETDFKVPEKDALLVKPQVVAEIQFAEITKEGVLRQASFVGIREDKQAKSVVLEVPNAV